MRQADIFLQSEGNAWLERNREKLGVRDPDPVMLAIEATEIKPKRVLEVGCADGWRLERLRDAYGCEVYGVEPSLKACVEAAARRVPCVQTSAATLPLPGQFDLVIYGFCLYLTDPSEWLRIAAEGDLMLAPGGTLIIHDFNPPMEPFARRYAHRDDVFSFHFDFARLWLSHPQYYAVDSTLHGDEMVKVLRKNVHTMKVTR